MTEYVILFEVPNFEDCSTICLTSVDNWETQPDIYDDTLIVNERFEAVCWCAAQIYCQYKLHNQRYDMSFCKKDKAEGNTLCMHFEDVRKKQADD